jgi:hypothetical protein
MKRTLLTLAIVASLLVACLTGTAMAEQESYIFGFSVPQLDMTTITNSDILIHFVSLWIIVVTHSSSPPLLILHLISALASSMARLLRTISSGISASGISRTACSVPAVSAES